MFKFTIRELLLLTVIVAMGVGWWIDRSQAASREQYWRTAAVMYAFDLATATDKPVEFVMPDGEKNFLLRSP